MLLLNWTRFISLYELKWGQQGLMMKIQTLLVLDKKGLALQ